MTAIPQFSKDYIQGENYVLDSPLHLKSAVEIVGLILLGDFRLFVPLQDRRIFMTNLQHEDVLFKHYVFPDSWTPDEPGRQLDWISQSVAAMVVRRFLSLSKETQGMFNTPSFPVSNSVVFLPFHVIHDDVLEYKKKQGDPPFYNFPTCYLFYSVSLTTAFTIINEMEGKGTSAKLYVFSLISSGTGHPFRGNSSNGIYHNCIVFYNPVSRLCTFSSSSGDANGNYGSKQCLKPYSCEFAKQHHIPICHSMVKVKKKTVRGFCVDAQKEASDMGSLLYYTILCYTGLYYTILYYSGLYYTGLYYTILDYTILYYRFQRPSTLRRVCSVRFSPVAEQNR